MTIFLFILFGFLGGILGGMGMGGGTILIPLLTIFLAVNQKAAQSINLLAFIPMAIIALLIHFKNKMVVKKWILWIIIPGVIFSVGFAFIASLLDNFILHTLFGIFLILIAVYETICLFTNDKDKENKNQK
jgi:uncharacterized membrane protein YfcA